MKKILQNLVKIIIIGSVLETTTVHCNRHSYPLAPLPYYQNYQYVPEFMPPYQDSPPVIYPERNFPPFVYPEYNYQSPAQLFHPNENYNPLGSLNPGSHMPIRSPYAMDYPYPDYLLSQKLSDPPNYQITLETNKKKINSKSPSKIQISNDNVKNEERPSQSNDEYNNYHDEDYSDNFGDDGSFQSNPCNSNSMYRYFEHDTNDPNSNKQFSLCGPYFYPHFGNNVYGLKTPLTLLPSRFPPRVEQFIEKIQNYFSTYTQPPVINPQNQTPTTVQPPTSTISESETSVSLQSANFDKKNGSSENNGETNPQTATVVEDINVEQVTEKAEVVPPFQNEQIHSTTEADVLKQQSPQMEVQNKQETSQIVENTTEVIVPNETSPQGTAQEILPTEPALNAINELDKSTETTTERSVVLETETQVAEVNTTESAQSENETEEYNSIPTTYQPVSHTKYHSHNLNHHQMPQFNH